MLNRRDLRRVVQQRRQLGDFDLWFARAVLIGFAALSGLAVVALGRIGDAALASFQRVAALGWWVPLVWLPGWTVLILWLTRRLAPGTAGSGIPQVMAALTPGLAGHQRDWLVSWRVSLAKLGLTCCGLLAGLSLGREGPSVQIAAGLMALAGRVPSRRRVAGHDELLIAGGAAGIAAAFNAPLAGVMFAIEELSRGPEQRRSGLIIGAIVFSGLVAVAIQGDNSYFGRIHATEIGSAELLPALLLGIAAGLAGGLFAWLMLRAAGASGASPVLAWRGRHPYAFALCCGLAIAITGMVSGGDTYGSGYHITRQLLDGHAFALAGLGTLLKFVATWLTTLCGVPGGIFAPALAIGALLGHDVASLFGAASSSALVALGMVGFLAATTQAPLTAFIVVMEMVDGHGIILSLMVAAVIGAGLSRLLSPPLYTTLARAMLSAAERHAGGASDGSAPGARTHPADGGP